MRNIAKHAAVTAENKLKLQGTIKAGLNGGLNIETDEATDRPIALTSAT